MRLYCTSCGMCHAFAEDDVERIIYTLQAQRSTAAFSEQETDGDPFFYVQCLHAIADESHDAESYLEWTESQIDGRKNNA